MSAAVLLQCVMSAEQEEKRLERKRDLKERKRLLAEEDRAKRARLQESDATA